ncbi:hypothetical protein DFJ73DRAFT_854721 [Zopfochytrium polystomum]|nr:hypothetical protein DFJ73DRAFT_854721 [Zopfochytrium polystomum]
MSVDKPRTDNPGTALIAQLTAWIKVEKHLLARLLYPNPVCLLTSCSSDGASRNVMTISWLTPLDNHGHFVCSMKSTRHTAAILFPDSHQHQQPIPHSRAVDSKTSEPDGGSATCTDNATVPDEEGGSTEKGPAAAVKFVLNVPTEGMEDLVRAVGGCSGRDCDKFATISDLPVCVPGRVDGSAGADSGSVAAKQTKKHKRAATQPTVPEHPVFALSNCCAHIVCRVDERQTRFGHEMLICTMAGGWVRPDYWDGRCFGPRQAESPALLSFLGSQTFASVRPEAA